MTLRHLLREIHRVDDLLIEKALVPLTEGFQVLAGPDEVCPLSGAEPAHLAQIVGYLQNLAEATVLDVTSAFHDLDSEVLLATDHVILVGLPNIPSIRTLKLYCEMFPKERVNHSLWVVINRYHPELKGFTVEEIKRILGTPRIQTIANDFPSVSLAINQGKSLRQAAPRTPILRDLGSLMWALLKVDRRQSPRTGEREAAVPPRARGDQGIGRAGAARDRRPVRRSAHPPHSRGAPPTANHRSPGPSSPAAWPA